MLVTMKKVVSTLFLLLAFVFCRPLAHSRPLDDVVLVIDPGHGDRAVGRVPADPGAQAQCEGGLASECVFTWDTGMRLKRLAEAAGAEVYLTLQAPDGDNKPHDWSARHFPEAGSGGFPYRTLVDYPEPTSVSQALNSRVATANRIYRNAPWRKRVYFFSLHFDSTSPDLSGVSFYYPPGVGRTAEVEALLQTVREDGRERRSSITGCEWRVAQEHFYAVLSNAENPNSFLVELANMRSLDTSGGNPDLWRMRDPRGREEFAGMLLRAVERFPRPLDRFRWLIFPVLGLSLLLGSVAGTVNHAGRSPGCRPTS